MKIDIVLNWYKSDAKFNIEILRTYINMNEELIEHFINNYFENKENNTIEIEYDEYNSQMVTYFIGLDDETYDLDGIFNEHIPNLHRYSVFVTLFSFLETELNELCKRIQNKDNLGLSFTDISGKGIDRAAKYLDKIAGIKITEEPNIWGNIKNMRELRNKIVHNAGKIDDSDRNDNSLKKFIKEKPDFLIGNSEIIIKNGFLLFVIDTIELLFKDIDKNLQNRVV
jgi:hypothetical protein